MENISLLILTALVTRFSYFRENMFKMHVKLFLQLTKMIEASKDYFSQFR